VIDKDITVAGRNIFQLINGVVGMLEKFQVLAGLWINLVDGAAIGEQRFAGGI
jgi:hypothetical protein